MKCLECQKEVPQTAGKREKLFCNSTCRSNFWQKAKRKNLEAQKERRPPKSTYIPYETISVSAKTTTKGVTSLSPKTLLELKSLCPKELKGFDRSQWIAKERQKYNL